MSRASKNTSEANWFKKHKVLSIVVALISLDLTVTGILKFGYYTVTCGGIPVKVTPPSFGVTYRVYNTPGHYIPGGSLTQYYCTEQEAIDSGAVKDLYQ